MLLLTKDPNPTFIKNLHSSMTLSRMPTMNNAEEQPNCWMRLKKMKSQTQNTKVSNLRSSSQSVQRLTTKSSEMIRQRLSRIEIESPFKKPCFQHPTITRKPKPVRIQDFVIGRRLGQGKFSDVHICQHRKTKTVYALKKLLKSDVQRYGMAKQLEKEFQLQSKINHPNIVQAYCKFQDEYHYFILLEYVEGKELLKYLRSTQKFTAVIIKQVIQALMYLHRVGIAHRDLKPQNIVITNGDTVKICDLGWAAQCQNGMRNTFCGTYDYVSPEVLDRQLHNTEVDVWAVGVLTYELLRGEVPFKDIRSKKQIRVENLSFPEWFSKNAIEFIKLFLVRQPKDRVNLQLSLRHAFLQQ